MRVRWFSLWCKLFVARYWFNFFFKWYWELRGIKKRFVQDYHNSKRRRKKLIHNCLVFLQDSTFELKTDATRIETADKTAATNVTTETYSVWLLIPAGISQTTDLVWVFDLPTDKTKHLLSSCSSFGTCLEHKNKSGSPNSTLEYPLSPIGWDKQINNLIDNDQNKIYKVSNFETSDNSLPDTEHVKEA